ncbi:hypothetical protein BDZ91DRAFT_54243 [Kalaharituber pfeilii]|nr:hypothetical protein BDZ91DRAFT_54243 [Kalaharituber pfeilii]
MPVMGMGRPSDLLSTHSNQISEHGISPSFGINSTMPSSTTTATTAAVAAAAAIGQAVGVISATSLSSSSVTMPASLPASSKTVSGPRPEVTCPLPNPDGSSCRKKCSGTFAYRSICEHIRRAHPDHWIPRLPASAESFRKMVSTPPLPKNTASSYQATGTGSGVGAQLASSSNVPRRSSTGVAAKARTKVSKPKAPSDEQHTEGMSSPSSAPELEVQVTATVQTDLKDPYGTELPQSSVASETDTESDHTHSPASPLSIPHSSAHTPSAITSKSSAVAKAKTTSSRKKTSSSASSKTKASPRKITARRRTIDKKSSSSALASLYSTPAASSNNLSSLAAGADLMDVDSDLTPRQHYLFGHCESRHCESRPLNEDGDDELDSEEVGLILGGMSKSHHDISTTHHSTHQIRRAYSFSVGDSGALPGVNSGSRSRGGLAVNTNLEVF